MDIQSHFNLLMSELYTELGMPSFEEGKEVHSFALPSNGSMHISFQPRTETIVFSRMLEQQLDKVSSDQYHELLGLNGFTDDPIKKGVFVDNARHPCFWIEAPLDGLGLPEAMEFMDELTINFQDND